MLDIKFIRENVKLMEKTAKNKGIDLDVKKLVKLDDERKKIQQQIDELRTQRNKIADDLKDPKKRTEDLKEKGRGIKDEIAALESEYAKILAEFNDLMFLVPNIYSADTPVGKDDKDNVEIAKVGTPTKFKFEPKDHITLGKELDILDLEAGVETAGFRGYYLKNEGARMHVAILNFALNKLLSKGFTPFIVPTLVREQALVNMGQFPMHKDETFQICNPGKNATGQEEESKYLVGTSEVSLISYYANKILDKKQLPIKMCGFSSCYRSEIGSYGKDTKGLYRVYEFWKIEQVIISENDIEKTLEYHNELRKISEEILQELKLPYHIIQACTGDMGQGKYIMYDIETWMPSRGKYGETHSNSALTDWQARRANIKYRDENGEIKYVHTLNNTAIASPRILIALWENYQNADGSITVPEALRPYMGGIEKITKK